eukprot:TRINITY_DN37034_c0_g1_i1.p1 TRINITY_DN37034_c0_g1~~TRINITY_DN37034_c0_g1_i1.p1  ORF type:complete len:807 (-),score=167.76 TRINITY_DN37034_c0_g1_i1:360-2780(-)
MQSFRGSPNAGYKLLPSEVDIADRNPGPAVDDESDILQFCSPIYYAQEGDDSNGAVEIDIIRFGKMESEVSVSFSTEDGSAKSGVKYFSNSGTLYFQPYESSKTISVYIMNDDNWSTVLDFKVKLHDPCGCMLANSLKSCRVKIIDDDAFPSNYFNVDATEEGTRIYAANSFRLMVDYIRLSVSPCPVRWRAILYLLLDSIHNAQYILMTYLNIYMVDVLFVGGEDTEEMLLIEGSREFNAMVFAGLYSGPIVILHLVDCIKANLGLTGMLEEFLQTSLFGKYMNYNDKERKNVDPTEMALALIRDCAQIVEQGFMKWVSLLRRGGKFIAIAIFVYLQSPAALCVMGGYLVAMMFLALCRVHTSIVLQEDVRQQEKVVVKDAHETCARYDLISDYRMRGAQNDRFVAKIKDLRSKKSRMKRTRVNTLYMPDWLERVLVGSYIYLMARPLLNKEMTIGSFLAMVGIFREISVECKTIYVELLEAMNTLGPLANVARYMNGRTDASDLRVAHTHARAKMKDFVLAGPKPFDYDSLPIIIEGVYFKYNVSPDAPWLIQTGRLVVKQSQLVAISGQRRSGKTTFLKILPHTIFPNEGEVFTPTNLKILNVDKMPMILDGSVWSNLAFGAPDADPERVKNILKRMEVKDCLDLLERELRGDYIGETATWCNKLSHTEIALMHLSRAFIANPQLLVVHRPENHFDHEQGRLILGLLRAYVTERGIEAKGKISTRRPRTCFYTTDEAEPASEIADQVWILEDSKVKTWDTNGSNGFMSPVKSPANDDVEQLQAIDSRSSRRFSCRNPPGKLMR